MTESPESQVEKLLSQMPLKEASDDLDLRICECLSAASVVSAGKNFAKPASRPSWLMLAAVAVLCLFLGGLIGRGSEQRVVADEANQEPDADGATVDFVDIESDGEGISVVADNNEVVHEGIRSFLEKAMNGPQAGTQKFVFPTLDTPPIATVCAMANQMAKEKGCTWCHDMSPVLRMQQIDQLNQSRSPLHSGISGVR